MHSGHLRRRLGFLACILWTIVACPVAPPDTDDSGDREESPPENQRPIAVATTEADNSLLITEAEEITLDGSQSYDPEAATLTYQWYCFNEAAIFSRGAQVPRPLVTLPRPGDYVFLLVVDDGMQPSVPVFLSITVEAPDAFVDSHLEQDNPSENQYRTIQAAMEAVEAAADGNEKLIAITHGPYEEQVNVADNVRLYGIRQEDGHLPLIHYAAAENEAVVLLGAHATLDSLRVACDAGPPGEATDRRAITVQHSGVKIIACRIEDSYSDGIYLTDQSEAKITACVLQNILGEGLEAKSETKLRVYDTRIVQSWGSAVWADGATEVHLENNVIYDAGCHGIHLNDSDAAVIIHCSIIDSGGDDSGQAGLMLEGGGQNSVHNNLIVVKEHGSHKGIEITPNGEAPSASAITHNYLYSKQSQPTYYAGDVFNTIDPSNWPHDHQTITEAPLLSDPEGGDFSLQAGSPAAGVAENGEDCGAQGEVLVEDTFDT
jgi:parallel beta-helix repeat protein